MKLPTLNEIKTKRSSVVQFYGLNKTMECSENEMQVATNVSCDSFPCISSRSLRRYASTAHDILGLVGGDKLYIVYSSHIRVVDGTGAHNINFTTALTDGLKQVVRMGAYLCIFPDGVIVNTSTETIEHIEHKFETTSVTFTLTNAYGDVITYHDDSYYASHDAVSGDYLLTDENGQSVLKQYNATEDTWVDITTSYIQISATGIGTGFKAGQGVKFTVNTTGWDEGKTLFPNGDLLSEATYVLKSVSANAVTIAGILKNTKVLSNAFKIQRTVPSIAYVTEHNNRLWACNEAGTEIYASALGDALCWNNFEGISTDSYVATIGSEGEFTGAITYLGYPMFFKQNSFIKIAVSASGAHVLKEVQARGVAKGCSRSLVICGELLHYKTKDGIVSYDGSLPTEISTKLGNLTSFKNVVGGSYGDKSYFCNETICYIYDGKKGLWVESDESFTHSCEINDVFVYGKNKLLTLYGAVANIVSMQEKNSDIKWCMETKELDYSTPDSKYIQKITLKCWLEVGSYIKASIKYDDGRYETIAQYRQKGTNIIPISLRMRRCDHFTLKLEGTGEMKLYSITKTLLEGSDKY